MSRWTQDGKLTRVKKPVIEVTFRKFSEVKSLKNREMRMNALIDSGADWSFLPNFVILGRKDFFSKFEITINEPS